MRIASHTPWMQAAVDEFAQHVARVVIKSPRAATSLAAMWRARYPEVPARSMDEFRSADAVAATVVGDDTVAVLDEEQHLSVHAFEKSL